MIICIGISQKLLTIYSNRRLNSFLKHSIRLNSTISDAQWKICLDFIQREKNTSLYMKLSNNTKNPCRVYCNLLYSRMDCCPLRTASIENGKQLKMEIKWFCLRMCGNCPSGNVYVT